MEVLYVIVCICCGGGEGASSEEFENAAGTGCVTTAGKKPIFTPVPGLGFAGDRVWSWARWCLGAVMLLFLSPRGASLVLLALLPPEGSAAGGAPGANPCGNIPRCGRPIAPA